MNVPVNPNASTEPIDAPTKHRVRWEVEIYAESREEAAHEAARMLRDVPLSHGDTLQVSDGYEFEPVVLQLEQRPRRRAKPRQDAGELCRAEVARAAELAITGCSFCQRRRARVHILMPHGAYRRCCDVCIGEHAETAREIRVLEQRAGR